MPTWRAAVATKFAQFYNVSMHNPPPDVNVPVASASEHLARAIKILPASEVNEAYMRETGFRFPTLVPQGLVKLAQPPENFTPAFVAQQIGKRKSIRVMDVEDQTDEEWPIGDWVEYYALPPASRQRIYNVISLEFTHTKLEHLVQAPEIAKKIDWVRFWPAEFKDPTIQLRGKMSFPKIQHYCLMGVANSYTDFHIDFGGTSVWYHVIRGEKIFVLVPPTEANLKLYEEWISNPKQDEIFFADLAEAAVAVTVLPGNSLLIPTGWIHAVYTPIDSFVFGGNFLHAYSIKLQLDIVDIENRSKVRRKFKFPFFEETNWFAVENYVERILAEAKKSGAKSGRAGQAPSPSQFNSPFVSLPGLDYPYGSQKSASGLPSSPYPGVKPEIWAAFQRTGYPPQLFPQWFQQVQAGYAYGSLAKTGGLPTNNGAESPSSATQRSLSPAPTNSAAAPSGNAAAGNVKQNSYSNSGSQAPTKNGNGTSTSGDLSGASGAQAANNASSQASTHQSTPYANQQAAFQQQQQQAMMQHQHQMAVQQQQLMQRRQVFAKGDPIDDTWLSMWEREGIIAWLDWLPNAKEEFFPLSIYNQPGGPGKAQYYIDVLTCFLRGVPLPQLNEYSKMHIHEPSPYPPAQLLCKVCALEDAPPGAPDTWIGCDYCGQWWHAACLGLTTEQAESLENYFCDDCRPVAHANRKRAKDAYIWLTKTPAHLLNNKYYHPNTASNLAAGMFMHPSHMSAPAQLPPQNPLPQGSLPPGMHPGMSPAAATFGMSPNNQNPNFAGYPGYASLPNMSGLPHMQGMQNPSNYQNAPNTANMQGMQFPFQVKQQNQQQLQFQQMKQQMMAQNPGHLANGNTSGNTTPHGNPMQLSPQHTPRMYPQLPNNAGFANSLPGMHPGQAPGPQGLPQGLPSHSPPSLPQGMYPPSQGMAHPSHYYPMGHMQQLGPMQEMDPRSQQQPPQQMMYPQAPLPLPSTAPIEPSNALVQNSVPPTTAHYASGQSMENTSTAETAPFQEGSGPVKRAKLEETS